MITIVNIFIKEEIITLQKRLNKFNGVNVIELKKE